MQGLDRSSRSALMVKGFEEQAIVNQLQAWGLPPSKPEVDEAAMSQERCCYCRCSRSRRFAMQMQVVSKDASALTNAFDGLCLGLLCFCRSCDINTSKVAVH